MVTVSLSVGRSGCPSERVVSRSLSLTVTSPPSGSKGSGSPLLLVNTTWKPTTSPGSTPAGSGNVPGALIAAPVWVAPSEVVTTSCAWSAPAGNFVTAADSKSKFSKVAGDWSEMVSEVTSAEEEELLRTPRVSVLSSPLPATAEPSDQLLVPTGVTTSGMCTVTSLSADLVSALSAVTVAVLGSTVPSVSWVSSGSRMPTSIEPLCPARRPVSPAGFCSGTL